MRVADLIQALNERMGFRKHSIVDLPDKQAWLSFCTRDQYAEAHTRWEAHKKQVEEGTRGIPPGLVEHLTGAPVHRLCGEDERRRAFRPCRGHSSAIDRGARRGP